MKKGWIWPLMIVAALLFTVGANVVMLSAASGDANGSVVEPEYYRKAVEWDRTMARRAESERLGWRAAVAMGALAGERAEAARTVRVVLTDSTGAVVRGADVTVTMIHNLDAATPVRGALVAAADGAYASALPALRRGLWEVRVDARRGTERFHVTLRTDAP
jgi:nitrogen fixation protein FixH